MGKEAARGRRPEDDSRRGYFVCLLRLFLIFIEITRAWSPGNRSIYYCPDLPRLLGKFRLFLSDGRKEDRVYV